jgi:hypothetical protein
MKTKVNTIVKIAIGMVAIIHITSAYAASNGSNIDLGDRTTTQGTGWTYNKNTNTWTVQGNDVAFTGTGLYSNVIIKNVTGNITVNQASISSGSLYIDNSNITLRLVGLRIYNGSLVLQNNSKVKMILGLTDDPRSNSFANTISGKEMEHETDVWIGTGEPAADPRPGNDATIRPALELPAGSELTVEADTATATLLGKTVKFEGTLRLFGGEERTALGPFPGQNMGKLIINSGYIYARGGDRYEWGNKTYECIEWWGTGACRGWDYTYDRVTSLEHAASIGASYERTANGGEIIINGGHIEAQDGIGRGNKISNGEGYITINGGIVTTNRLGFNNANSLVINGGSVKCARLGHSDRIDEGNIKNTAGSTLYPVKIGVATSFTEGYASTTLNTPVINSEFDNIIVDYATANNTPNPANGIYGVKDIMTDNDGYLYFWLPTTGSFPADPRFSWLPGYTATAITTDIALTVGDKTYISTAARPTEETTIYATKTGGSSEHKMLLTANSNPITISTPLGYSNANATVNIKDLTDTHKPKGIGQINVEVTEGPFTVTPANCNFDFPGTNSNFTVKPNPNLAQGTYTGQITISGATYQINTSRVIPIKFVVTKPLQATLTINDFGAKTYTSTKFTPSLNGGSGTGTVTWISSDTTVATVKATSGEVTIAGVGSTTLTATKAGGSTYENAIATRKLTVTRATRTGFALPTTLTKTFADPSFTPVLTDSVGKGTVTWTSSNTTVATVNDSTGLVTILTAGSTLLTATQDADPLYLTSTSTCALTVDKAAQGDFYINNPATTTYGTPDFDLNTDGGISDIPTQWTGNDDDVATISSTGNVHIKNAGTVKFTATKPTNNNYLQAKAELTLIIDKAAQGDFYINNPGTTTYGDPNFNLNTTGGVDDITTQWTGNNDYVATISSTGNVNIKNAGTVKFTATKHTDNKYLQAQAELELTIDKATVNVTPNDLTKVYGDHDPTLTYSHSTLKYNDKTDNVFTGTLTRTQGENAGNYDILTDQLTVSDNYDVHFNTGAKLTITKAPITITPRDTAKVYGDDDPTLTYSWTILKNNDTPDQVFNGTLTREQGDNAGNYNILTDQLNVSDNYDVHFVEGARLTINKAPLTITTRDTSKVYGDDDPQLTYRYSTLANNDTPDKVFTGTLTRTQGENAGNYDILTDQLNVSDNYDVHFNTGAKLTINKATLNVTARDTNTVYLDTIPKLTLAYNGFVLGEDSSVLTTQPTANTTAVQGDEVGTYPINVTEATAKNYSINYNNATLTITKRIPNASDLYISTDTAVYTGKTQIVTVDTLGVKGFGKISNVKYNGSIIPPITPGKYAITVNVDEGKNYNNATTLLVDTLVINKAPIDSVKLTVDNEATPDKALVIPKNITGLGTIIVKFDGSTETPTAPGEYKVTVDHTNGLYYKDANDFLVGTYIITESDPTNNYPVTKITHGKVWTSKNKLIIHAQYNDMVRIYTLAGQLHTTLNVNAGETKELTIHTGFYVVVLDGKTHKVMVR